MRFEMPVNGLLKALDRSCTGLWNTFKRPQSNSNSLSFNSLETPFKGLHNAFKQPFGRSVNGLFQAFEGPLKASERLAEGL